MQATPTPNPPNPAVESAAGQPATGCPTPLTVHQVLEQFRAGADRFQVRRDKRILHGRAFGTGRPLYFLNGLVGDHELFALVAWLLRDAFRCVMMDYPARRRWRPALSLDQLAGDLIAVADTQGDAAFSLFAASFGGLVALRAMKDHPERIPTAILQGAFARRQLSWFERLMAGFCRFVPGTLGRFPLRTAVQKWNHRPWFPPFDPVRWPFFLDNTGQTRIAAAADRVRLVRRHDLRPDLPKIAQRILLVSCEGDGNRLTACQAELQSGLPNATSEWIDNCGQLPSLTHPHRLAKLIRTFFDADEQQLH